MDTNGWSISFGDFGRGFSKDVSALLSDGPTTIRLFADQDLDTSRFHHVALVLDRSAKQARLYLDGAVVAAAGTGTFGALTTTVPLLFGGFTGVVDEARISRAARTAFHPVLGEDDESYRRRLRIFQRWTLSTPAEFQRALNSVVGTVQGVSDPFVVDDANSVLFGGRHPVLVLPAGVPGGGSVDELGRRNSAEVEVCGAVADDSAFDPAMLADGSDARADFAGRTTMRVGTRRALRALLDLLAAESVPGRLRVVSAYDPAANDLRAVGRAVLLSHNGLGPDTLAVYAHRAGFSWVNHRFDDRVYASVRSTDTIEILPGADLVEQQTLAVRVEPPPPLGTRCAWSVIVTGAGRADITAAVDSPNATITARHTGEVTIDVQLNRGPRAFSANRVLRIGLDTLPVNDSIGADGARGVAEATAGSPDDSAFDPAYLVTVGGERLQAATAGLFNALVAVATGAPKLTSGWRPGGTGLETVGRALTVEPGTSPVTVGRLAALAHDVGFDYVRNAGSAVRLAASAGDPLAITGATTVTEGAAIPLTLRPKASTVAGVLAGTTLCVANSGTETVSFVAPDGTITRAVKLPSAPAAITAKPDGKVVFTADNGVTAVDVVSGQITGTATFGPGAGKPAAIAHNPASQALYVARQGTDDLVVLNSSTLLVTAVRPVSRNPVAIAVNPAGTTVWLAFAGDPVVRTVDTATNTVSAPITLPGPAAGIAVTATRAYVSVSTPNRLVVFDTATKAVIATLTDIGPAPGAVTATPDGSAVFVADVTEGAIYPRKADGTAAAPTPVRTGHTPVGLVTQNRLLYVVNQSVQGGADNIGVLDLIHPSVLATVWSLGAGRGERLSWTVRAAADASGRVSSSTAPEVDLTGMRPGPLVVEAFYSGRDHNQPYTVRIRLNAALEALELAGTPVVLHKDQYDLVMNVLSELHPIGVEIDTSVIRAHVLEVRAGPRDVYPAYTFPGFRLGRLKPPVSRGEKTT
jgi:DNA-binding beta-propeller fold protein YncE